MSVSTAVQYVIRTVDGRLVCSRCMDYSNDKSSYPHNRPTEEERFRHVLYVCPQMDAGDREKYLQIYPQGDIINS